MQHNTTNLPCKRNEQLKKNKKKNASLDQLSKSHNSINQDRDSLISKTVTFAAKPTHETTECCILGGRHIPKSTGIQKSPETSTNPLPICCNPLQIRREVAENVVPFQESLLLNTWAPSLSLSFAIATILALSSPTVLFSESKGPVVKLECQQGPDFRRFYAMSLRKSASSPQLRLEFGHWRHVCSPVPHIYK